MEDMKLVGVQLFATKERQLNYLKHKISERETDGWKTSIETYLNEFKTNLNKLVKKIDDNLIPDLDNIVNRWKNYLIRPKC
jgi:hypothetical protein